MESAGVKVYVGNCEGISEGELRDEFSRFGRLENVWIARNPPGFAFCWFTDERDASDAVHALDGKPLAGKTLRVEISHNRAGRRDRDDRGGGDRDRGGYGGGGRPLPLSGRGPPRKTGYKVRIYNLPTNTHWTELKDFMRKVGEVIYTNVENEEGLAEFANREAMERAHKELDDASFGDRRIRVDINDESDRYKHSSRERSPPPRRGRSPVYSSYSNSRGQSRSPPPRRRSRSPPPRRYSRSRSRSPRYRDYY